MRGFAEGRTHFAHRTVVDVRVTDPGSACVALEVDGAVTGGYDAAAAGREASLHQLDAAIRCRK